MQAGEGVMGAGAYIVAFFVVRAGRVWVVRPFASTETLVAVHGPGQFTGEVNMHSGRPALVRSRASESGEVIELDHEQLLALVQTDSEISELIMRAFILRRVAVVAHRLGKVSVVRPHPCAGTLLGN